MLARRLLAGAVVAVALSASVATATAAPQPFAKPRPRPSAALERPAGDLPVGRNSYTVPEAPSSPDCGAHFCVHWVDQGPDAPRPKDSDGDGVPDYVERVLTVAEHVHEVENDELGWREPLSDGTLGGGAGETDVYLAEIGPRLFGYAAPDPAKDEDDRPPRRLSGFLVLDNDYEPFEFPQTTQGRDLKVTFAHEYNHILQFGYEAYEDPWFAESTAVWMEDQVYNGIDDYLRYVRHWVKMADTPLTANSLKMYGSAVWNEWLAHHYGPALIREAWADAAEAQPDGFAVAAYESAIRAAGPSSFGHDFTRFAADVAEWRTGIGFRESDLYPDMPRQGSLELGAAPVTHPLDHTTFSLLGVPTTAGGAVEVTVTAPEDVAAGLALVGRLGSERQGSTVKAIAYSRTGGTLTARISDPGRYQRITAVLVNADTNVDGFSARRVDWNYSAEEAPFDVSARVVR
jgi:hypothetical protein